MLQQRQLRDGLLRKSEQAAAALEARTHKEMKTKLIRKLRAEARQANADRVRMAKEYVEGGQLAA